jgi:hypothetical protein
MRRTHPFKIIPAKAHGRQVKVLNVIGLMVREQLIACHSEGATCSTSKSKQIKVKGDVPKAKATEESLVQAGKKISFDLSQQKNRACLWKRKILHRPKE